MLKEVSTVSVLIVVVLLVRAMFKNRVPKRMLYALWLVVLLKLCLPGTLFSLPVLPAENAAAPAQSAELPAQTAPVIHQPTQTVTQPQAPTQQPVSPAQETAKPTAKPLTTQILQIVWFSGSALLGLWLFGAWAVFTIRLHRDRRFLGKRGGTRIYVSDAVKSPCLAGLIPAVYLTEDVMQTDEAELIVRHELTHLRQLDFLWSFCRAAAVTVYWWNPFIWLAAICSKRDAELACDEAVAARLPDKERLAYARAILAQAPRKTATLSLAGSPVKERILFLTKKQRTSVLCVILALLLVVSATGCSFAELTRQKSEEITMSGDAEAAHQEALKDELKTATPLTQEQINAVNAVFADYALSTDETLGHFAVNGFFTSTYDDVRNLNLNNFLAYFGECGEDDISEEEFAQLNAKWEFRVDSVADFPLPIHRYPASAVEGVLRRFAGIGLADLKDIQEPFSDYTYLEETDAFYNTTSDYSPGYFICSGGEIEPGGDYALLYGSAVGRLSGDVVLSLTKDGKNWYIHSFTLEIPADELPAREAEIPTVESETSTQKQTEEASGLDQTDIEYDDVKTWSWAPYQTLYRTDGVRMGLVQEADGTRHVGAVPDTKVWIRLKDGTLLSGNPFDACIDYMGTPEGEVYCVRDGTGYRYTVSAVDGSFRLSEVDEPETLEEGHFGYRLRVTRWDSREPCYGIVAADGTEVIAPLYERVEIPFPDRFLLYEGGASQGPVMGRCRLTDETGSTLCTRFHWIDYSVFEDGYIGIAVCYGERASYPCYDENGQPMPEGYWLVDRDGNLCSERFAKLSFGDGDETHAASKDDVLRALREDGTELLLTAAELLPLE